MKKPEIAEDTSLTESQVVRLRDVPASVRKPVEVESSASQVSIIGESLYFKGDLAAAEDLVIEGTVEGTVHQDKCSLTVMPKGRLIANVNATRIFVEGKVKGDLHATVSVKVLKGGEVEGNIVAPSISIEEGATFNGSVEMRQPKES